MRIVSLLRRVTTGLVLLVILWTAGLAVMARVGAAPALGVVADALTPCPPSPNCVSTTHATAPMPVLPMRGDAADTLNRLADLIAARPRTTIVERGPRYLRAEFRSRLFRYVDDVEFLVVEPGTVHFRSASRLGRGDMGVNRARMEELSAAYQR